MAAILKDLIPTFSASSPLETAKRLEIDHEPGDVYIAADGSGWDRDQHHLVISSVDHPLVKAILPFLDFSPNHWFTPSHLTALSHFLVESDRQLSLSRLGSARGVLRTRGYTLSGLGVQNSLNYARAYFGARPLLRHLPVRQYHTGDDALFAVQGASATLVTEVLDHLYVPRRESQEHMRVHGRPLARALGWTRKNPHTPSEYPDTLSKVFIPTAAGWIPVRPIAKTAATALVNWSGMAPNLHHAAASHGYAPWGSGQVLYYAAWRSWRERRAGCVVSAARAFSLWSRATRENPQYKRPTDDGPFETIPGQFTADIATALNLPLQRLE